MVRLFALLLSIAMLACAPPAAAAPPDPALLAPYVARELAPGVHLLATPPEYLGDVTSNIVVIEQSDGLVVIDSGLTAADGRRVVAFARSLGGKPVKALLYTHWHNDHPQGGSEIKAAWPNVRIVSTAATARWLREATARYVGYQPNIWFDAIYRQQVEGLHRQIDDALKDDSLDEATRGRYERMKRESTLRIADFRGTSLALPTETYTDRLMLDDSERPVELLFLGRANTDGDAIAWLPKERIVATGDVVVSPIPFGFGSYPADWQKVLQRLKAMNYSILVPGHGEPQRDTVYIDRVAATLADIRSQVGPLARRGLSVEKIRERTDYSAQMAIFGDTPRHKRLFEAYWLKPMTINAWMEARRIPVVQSDESLYAQ